MLVIDSSESKSVVTFILSYVLMCYAQPGEYLGVRTAQILIEDRVGSIFKR